LKPSILFLLIWSFC